MAAKRKNVMQDDIAATLSGDGNSDAAIAELASAGRVAEPAGVLYEYSDGKRHKPMLVAPDPTRRGQGSPSVGPLVPQSRAADQSRIDELEIDPAQIEQLAALFAQIDDAVTGLSRKMRRTSDVIDEIRHNYRLANKALGHYI